MGNEDQALTAHSKKRKRDNHHHRGKHSHEREVMREDTLPEFVLKIRMALKRRTTKENIMLTLQRMMIIPGRESNKKVNILQVMKNIF